MSTKRSDQLRRAIIDISSDARSTESVHAVLEALPSDIAQSFVVTMGRALGRISTVDDREIVRRAAAAALNRRPSNAELLVRYDKLGGGRGAASTVAMRVHPAEPIARDSLRRHIQRLDRRRKTIQDMSEP